VFTRHELPADRLAPGELVMMTIRSHDQFNTTVYGLDDRYRGIYNGRRVVFMNPDDMRDLGIVQGQLVDLTGRFRGETRRAQRFMAAPYQLPRRCAATYFPEANVLVPVDSVAEFSNTPTSKSVVITVAPSPAEAGPGAP
jgi:anaerobic selenocysteine-containing dehydrogenase